MDNVPPDLIDYANERSCGKLYLHMWALAKELGFKFGNDEDNINPLDILTGNNIIADYIRILKHPEITNHCESKHYKYLVDFRFVGTSR